MTKSLETPLPPRALRLARGGRVLEVGCGRGVALPVLADVRDLPFASGSFDLVIDMGTCYHLAGITGQLTALNEIARVLRVGGLLVHETRFAQRLAHPIRSLRRRLPWTAMTMFVPERSALLWTARRRVGPVLM